MSVRRWVIGIAAALLALLGALALLASRRRVDAKLAVADALDALARPQLSPHLASNNEQAATAVAETKAKLQKRYESLGLSPDEIARRYDGLSI